MRCGRNSRDTARVHLHHDDDVPSKQAAVWISSFVCQTFVVIRNSRPSASVRVPPPLQVLFLNVAISASDPHARIERTQYASETHSCDELLMASQLIGHLQRARLNPHELALHAVDPSHTPVSNSWSNRSSSR
jgi:hypothetical protein